MSTKNTKNTKNTNQKPNTNRRITEIKIEASNLLAQAFKNLKELNDLANREACIPVIIQPESRKLLKTKTSLRCFVALRRTACSRKPGSHF
jgi:hypothetical protein